MKVIRFFNVYPPRSPEGDFVTGALHPSREAAERYAGPDCIATHGFEIELETKETDHD